MIAGKTVFRAGEITCVFTGKWLAGGSSWQQQIKMTCHPDAIRHSVDRAGRIFAKSDAIGAAQRPAER